VASEGPAADRDALPVDGAGDPLAGILVDVGRHRQPESRVLCGADERRAEHVRGEAVDRGGQPQEFPRREAVERHDLADLGRADGQRAGLVEQHGPRLAERLDRTGALDDHTAARGARHAGHQRDRRRENQRARRRDHDDGERALRVAAERPRQARGEHGDGQEDARIAVGHAYERGALRLGLLDQPDQCGVRALGGGTVGAHVERAARIGAAAHHRHSGMERDGQRLAAEGARVHDGLAADDGAVDGNDLSRADEHRVTGLHAVDGDLLERAIDPQLGDARRPLHEERELAARAPGGGGLQGGAAGEHQADERAGELLAERQRADHRDERDRVDAEVMIDHDGAADLEAELGGEQRDRGPPDLVPGVGCAHEVQREPRPDRDDRDSGQDLGARLGEPAQLGAYPGGDAGWRRRRHERSFPPAARDVIRAGPRARVGNPVSRAHPPRPCGTVGRNARKSCKRGIRTPT
jgi:hypothetical protein